MSIILESGETKRLDVILTPVAINEIELYAGVENVIIWPWTSTTPELAFAECGTKVQTVWNENRTQMWGPEVYPPAVNLFEIIKEHVYYVYMSEDCVLHKPVQPTVYSLSEGTWDAEMPFAAGSVHHFDINFTNISEERYDYDVTLTFAGSSYRKAGSIAPGFGAGLGTSWSMPGQGTYDMILTVIINGELVDELVVSRVEVV
jgi:hypothetical protein